LVLFVTIWAALLLFVVAEIGYRAAEGRAGRWARSASVAGAVLAILHAVLALADRYGWDHEAAVRATAEQSAALYGFGWRGSIYVNYVFLALWLGAAWSWRSRAWRHWAWRVFVLTMIVNGAIVFARPAARPFGTALVAALLWAWRPRGRAETRT
jgi:hypothetical protein